ncbi:ubiquitin-conjugating enzyme family protein [Rutstroemia sp. NJR-2017a BBW]|nr:ubiquitin-conjugating enzyme family protein [Rutstroemia sp. NJR-2017a BBW]
MKNLVPPNSVVPTVTPNNNSDIVIDSRIPIWHGDLSRFDRDADYLHMRDRLSNAAYYGQMRDVVDTLAMGEVEYGERWANAPKLRYDPLRASGWTPLHQAVYMGSSIHEIKRLIEEFGASRLARTILAGDLPYPSMTALEIAQHLGATHLESVLAPVIYHAVPNNVLSRVQERFHGLVREDLGRRAAKGLRLPELEVLGELRVPLMWFPLRQSQGEGGVRT